MRALSCETPCQYTFEVIIWNMPQPTCLGANALAGSYVQSDSRYYVASSI